MIQHNLFYHPYASFTNVQLPLLKVAAVWCDKLVILDPVGASWDTVGAEWLLDWRDGKKSLQENGLHYLLSFDNLNHMGGPTARKGGVDDE